jgi:hypothetical protein
MFYHRREPPQCRSCWQRLGVARRREPGVALKVVNAALNAGTIDLLRRQAIDDIPMRWRPPTCSDYGAHAHVRGDDTPERDRVAAADYRSTSDIRCWSPDSGRCMIAADDNIVPLAGACRVRFVNASSDNAAYDVYVGDTKQVSALAARSASDYVTLVPATYTFTFRDPASGATVLTVADQQIGEGRVATFYVAGAVGRLSSIASTDR